HIADGNGIQVDSPADESAPGFAPIYNTIGALWIPSVKSGSTYTTGSMQFYFNNVPFGTKITWVGPVPTDSFKSSTDNS
ncbi:hypothetical protein ACSTK4_23645, partial [Vibrio parahaemolyticus]